MKGSAAAERFVLSHRTILMKIESCKSRPKNFKLKVAEGCRECYVVANHVLPDNFSGEHFSVPTLPRESGERTRCSPRACPFQGHSPPELTM